MRAGRKVIAALQRFFDEYGDDDTRRHEFGHRPRCVRFSRPGCGRGFAALGLLEASIIGTCVLQGLGPAAAHDGTSNARSASRAASG